MAAVDRRNPSVDDFLGLNWSCWVDRVNVSPSDADSNDGNGSKCERNLSETMSLRKEDMHIFGHCPTYDDLFLVVCSHCGMVVKPQAFERHCEWRHGLLTKMCSQSSILAPQQQPGPGRPLSSLSSFKEKKDGKCADGGAQSSSVLPVRQHRPTKAQEVTRVHHHMGASPTGHCPSSTPLSEIPPVQKSSGGPSCEAHSPLRGPRTYSRIYRNIDKKECDLNKHRGGLGPGRKKQCSQELKCSTDSVHQQQKSLGKSIDLLAAVQRSASAAEDMSQFSVKLKHNEQHLEEKITTQVISYNFNSNCHMFRFRDSSESFPEEDGYTTVKVEVHPPYPFNQSLLSSEESKDDDQEDPTDLPSSPRHPKPLGLCTFGCRTLGCSIFTFDRRWRHLRFAVCAMMEHHINTHLWKKRPHVSSGLRSVTPPHFQAGSRLFQSNGSFGLASTSLEQLETKTSQHSSHRTKLASSTSTGPGRRCNPVGQPHKPRLKEGESMQNACTTKKRTKLSQDKSHKYIREPPLDKKGQPYVTSTQGPANSTFSQGKKMSPPVLLQPLERQLSDPPLPGITYHNPSSRGRPPGIQQKVVGYDMHLGQKRKGSNESSPLSSSRSRTSKCKRLSPNPAPTFSLVKERLSGIGSLRTWRKDSTLKSE